MELNHPEPCLQSAAVCEDRLALVSALEARMAAKHADAHARVDKLVHLTEELVGYSAYAPEESPDGVSERSDNADPEGRVSLFTLIREVNARIEQWPADKRAEVDSWIKRTSALRYDDE